MKMKTPRKRTVRSKPSKGLDVRAIHGYTAVRPIQSGQATGWVYLRRHSESELFVGNLPQPVWFTPSQLHGDTTSTELQERIKRVIKGMVPSALRVGEVFSTGNGRLASRVVMKDGDGGVENVLTRPHEYLDMDWERLARGCEEEENAEKEGVVERWLREYEEERNVNRVQRWSDAAMKAFETREKAKKEAEEKAAREGAVADEDGFVMVTSGAKQIKADEAMKVGTRGRTGKGSYKSKSARNRRKLLDLEKGIEKDGFYRWQKERKSAVKELQSKFKEDQRRIRAVQALDKGK
eukprot:GFKZ01001364.1.p1 GENE.GFKZ01001364.1~~GFKZ01001364.1.p1  ORF type:complete len:294 (+),score=56.67 GFKZ01001364.1:138-1019(+)